MTPTPPQLDLAALTVIANAATEGPWRIYSVTDSGGRSAAVETAWAHDEQGEDTELVTDWCTPEDAAHIAAFDPPTVLALIARAEAAEAKIAAVQELHKPFEAEEYYNGMDGESLSRMVSECSGCADVGGIRRYPCPTIVALDGTA